jgi:pyrroloquinoline quinone (PQQ) biosynthesis protein C
LHAEKQRRLPRQLQQPTPTLGLAQWWVINCFYHFANIFMYLLPIYRRARLPQGSQQELKAMMLLQAMKTAEVESVVVATMRMGRAGMTALAMATPQ